MKKILVFLPFVILILFSCKSAPAPTPATDAAPAIDTTVGLADVEEAKKRAVNAMNRAKSVRADVAARENFNNALAVFDEAEKEIPTAANMAALNTKYFEAEMLFFTAYEDTILKRERAQRELNRAREVIRQVESDAESFEREQGASNP